MDRALRFAREARPLHRVVPLKRRTFHVGDQPDFCAARFLNPDFSRITIQKTVLISREAASRGRSGSSGSGQYSSPLDFSRPGTSGYRKRSASPSRGSYKRGRRGRCRTPSSNRSKGFRRWESCPNPIAVGGCLSLHWQVWSGTLGSGSLAVGISDSLLSGSHLIQGSHPFSGLLPRLDQGQDSGGGFLAVEHCIYVFLFAGFIF